MNKEVISIDKAPGAIGPYSQGIKIGSFVYTSGQLPINAVNGEMPEGIEAQTKQSLENVKAILEAGGSCMKNAVKLLIFLKDMNDFVKMNEVYSQFFSENYPVRSCVEVARLPKDALVKIEAIGTVEY
jgi:2-iminobutanoate/2-iminopropanoate deaminase